MLRHSYQCANVAGFDESVEHIHKALVEQGPFDGVMGFSQGGCMAMIVAALVRALTPITIFTELIPRRRSRDYIQSFQLNRLYPK